MVVGLRFDDRGDDCLRDQLRHLGRDRRIQHEYAPEGPALCIFGGKPRHRALFDQIWVYSEQECQIVDTDCAGNPPMTGHARG